MKRPESVVKLSLSLSCWCTCAGVVMSSSDCLRPEVAFQQRRTGQVPLPFGGRSEEDIGEPTGEQHTCKHRAPAVLLLASFMRPTVRSTVFAGSQQLPRVLPSAGETEEQLPAGGAG